MIRKSVHKIILVAVLMLIATISSFAQYNSEEELKEGAAELFDEGKYNKALPLYSQLLSTYPKDVNYNFKYGTCLLIGSEKKDDALKYLKYSVTKSTVDPLANYFLAKAYHHNYEFSPAIVYYNKFKEKGNSKDIQRYDVDREIAMCKNGENLIKSMTDIGVLSKKNIRATDFFRSYDLKGIGGKIIVKPDEFKTKLDKKKNETSIIYLGEKRDMVVFSSYGNNGSNGKDIFKVVKLPNGEWSKPTLLLGKINSKFDEDYPFLHPNGNTLYFCSKGFNSMGGYDVFKSTKDPRTGEWGYPENMDFPINTPDDDILYISDIDNELAYFASSRASKQDELTVYRVTVDAPPVENSIVKGFFLAEADPGMRDATITIRDVEKDRRYGVYKTHSETGEYLLVFPSNGGKFKILVETKNDAPIHSATIELPVLDGFRALKQELRLVGTGDDEKLVVKNLFDETDEFDIHDPLFVEHVLKKRADLDVNTTEDELNASKETATNVVADNSSSEYSKLSNDQIVNQTDKTASKITEQTQKSKEQTKAAYTLANEKSNDAKMLYAESEKLIEEANESNDENEKQSKLYEAEQKKLEAAKLVNETVAALNIAKIIDSEATERESDVATVNNLQEAINKSIDENDRAEAEKNYKKLEEIAAATYHNESALNIEKDLNDKKLLAEKEKYNKARDRVTELTNREYELSETIKKLEQKKADTRKKSEKADYQSRIDVLTIDLEDNKYELANVKKKEIEAKTTYDKAKNEAKVTSTVIADVNNTTVTSTDINDNAKLQIENDIAYFEKEGLVGLYPTDESLVADNTNYSGRSPKIYNLTKYKDEYEIVNEDGELIDYNTDFSVELTETDNITNETEKALAIVAVNQKWIESIDQEIVIRENQLTATTNESDKTELENKLVSLRELKDAKQSEIEAKGDLIAENTSSNNTETTNEVNENNTTVNTNEINETETNNAINEASSKVNIVNKDGSIADYGTGFTEKLATTSDEDSYEAYTEKAKIHTEWAAAIDQEILIRKMELAEADESDKNDIENKIAVLENNKVEQEEYVTLYNMQAESMQPLATNEQPENNETLDNTNNSSTSNNESENNEENENTTNNASNENNRNDNSAVNNNETETNENNVVENNTTNNETENNTVVENNNENATNETNNEVDNSTVTNNEASTSPSNSVEVYELSPSKLRAEEDDFSNLKYYEGFEYQSDNSKEKVANIADLKAEARKLKEEADVKLNTASTTSSQDKKAELIAESDKLVDQSNQKQEEVARIYETANRNEFKNNQDVLNQLKKDNNDEYSNQSLMIDLYEGEADGYYADAQVQREKAINASSFTVKEVALQKAYELEMKAINKQSEAIAKLVGENDVNEIYANVESENIAENNENSNARTNNNETVNNENEVENNENNVATNETNSTENNTSNSNNENETNENNNVSENETSTNEIASTNNNESTNNTSAGLNDEVTEEDKKVLMNLTPVEITAVKQSEDYQEYATLKKENRRLVKEAEVEYAEAEIYEQEANDQKQLELSLQALAAGASTDEDKAKKAKQLEKLKAMIAENETKSQELKQSATTKEQTVESNNQKTDAILINADEATAQNFTTIEKVETFDADLMAEAMSRTGVATNENTVATNEQPENNNNSTENSTSRTNNETENNENENASNETSTENEVENNETNENTTDNSSNENNLVENNTTENNETQNNVVENNTTNENENNENATNNEVDNSTTTENNETTTNEAVNNENETSTNETNEVVTNETENNSNNDNVATNENSTTTNETNNNTSESTSNVSIENINEVPSKLVNSIFLINNNNQPVYNSSNPIPTVDKMPEGLVFKVQIGAFRNPIPQNHFKGFAPIMAEDAGNGITRYTAGLFTGINMAVEAKNSIRTIGYNDAFVVAFYNGERISIAKAREMMGDEVVADNSTNENNSVTNENSVSTNEVENTTTNNEQPTTNNQPQTEEVKDGVSTDVRNIDGVFYAIQVGVYSKPVSAGQLNNVSPLNSERLANGLIRYTSGVYKNLNDANSAKDRIRGIGISDAFVVAYNGGQKITVAQANEMLAGGNNNNNNNSSNNDGLRVPGEIEEDDSSTAESETDVNENYLPVEEDDTPIEENDTPLEENDTPLEENDTPVETNSTTPENLNLEFKVKLGEYEEDVPVEDAALFLKLTPRGVKNYEENGKTIYTIGSFKDYQPALDMQIEMKEEGVKKPETIVFNDGQPIPLDEALELIKNNK